MTEWYYSKMGLQQGPVPEDELLTKIRRGEIDGSNLVWKDGMAEWKPVSQVPELMAPPLPVYASPPMREPTTTAIEPGGNIPMPQPPAYDGNYVVPNIPSHMVPSIIALVLCCVSMAIICLPIGLPFAIVAVVYGTKVDSLRVQGNVNAAQAASKSAKIWMILAYVMAGLPILGLLGFFAFAIISSL